MIRSTIASLLLLLLLSPATAAENPFEGWTQEEVEAHRKSEARRVEARAKLFLEGRKNLTEACALCRGLGWMPIFAPGEPDPCLLCGGTGRGLILRMELADFERLYLRSDDPGWREERLLIFGDLVGAAEDFRLHATPLALSSYEIREIHVLGEAAAVLAETTSLARKAPEPVPSETRREVVRFVLREGEWWIADEKSQAAWKEAARYPEKHRRKPDQDAAALALLGKARSLVHHFALPEDHELGFMAEVLTPFTRTKARYEATIRPPEALSVKEERIPEDLYPEFRLPVLEVVRGVIESTLLRNLLPDPAKVHLQMLPGEPGTVAFRGFSPDILGQEGELSFGEDGLPVRARVGDRELQFEWKKVGELHVPARIETPSSEDGKPDVTEIRYRTVKGLVLPYLVEITGSAGEWEIRLRRFELVPED